MADQDGFSKEFATLIEPHHQRLFRLAFRLCGSRADAEDLLQDVLIKLYQRRQELSSIKDLKPWLGRVLYNQFVDNGRRNQRRQLILVGNANPDTDSAATADPQTEPVTATTSAETASRLQRALARVSEDHRILLLMHDAEGYTLPEIESLTGTPIGTLKSRLSRARARLRDLLKSEDAPLATDVDQDFQGAPAARQTDRKKREPFSSNQRVGR